MKDAIQQIGAIAGLASFLGLGILAFLYFAQARRVRDLEDKATFVPDDADLPASVPATAAVGAATSEKGGAAEPERQAAAAATPAGAAAAQLEAARQTEVARASAERRQRFHQRRGGDPFTGDADARGAGASGGARRMPEPRAMIVIGLGVAVLLAGVIFGASRLLGGDGDSGTATTDAANTAQGTGAPVEVAVLNGTPVPGLAAKIGAMVRNAGSYKLGNVTNTETPFDLTTVMFDPSDAEAKATAQTLAGQLQVTQVLPMTGEVKKAAIPSTVAVVVGEDRAGT